ncbi:MAG: hypothetical protein ACE5KT_03940 [Methanosarcinales archaeon]
MKAWNLEQSKIKKWKKEDEEEKELRRKYADWDFIDKQSPRVRAALKILVENGDMYVAAKVAGVKLEKMNDLRIKANIYIISR